MLVTSTRGEGNVTSRGWRPTGDLRVYRGWWATCRSLAAGLVAGIRRFWRVVAGV